jgi:ABC-2 type transport system ATP-binding protein
MQVHVSDLAFSYASKPILRGISFEVQSGEVLGILGVNGAGKSTLLKLLCGLLPIQSGRINHIPKDKLGVVFQEASLDPKLSGHENLKLFASLYAGAKVPDSVDGVDLNMPVGKLSGGQKRKLELARVFVHSPELVLMDEPTTGLDLGATEIFWRNVRERRVTAIINTHKAEEAERCDRLLLIHEGKILLSETPSEFKKRVSSEPIVEVRQPSLADAFLKVTGVSLK